MPEQVSRYQSEFDDTKNHKDEVELDLDVILVVGL